METKPFRAFFAIELPEDAKQAMTAATEPLRSDPSLQQIKWTKPDNLHITLCFLGNISEQQHQCIDQKIGSIIKNMHGFRITLTALQPLPNAEKFHVLAVKAEPYVELATLALTIKHTVTTCGIPGEDRLFNPHLTLGRIKSHHKTNCALLSNIILPPISFDTTAVKLFKSEPQPAGSVYAEVAVYDLNNAD